MSPPNSLRLARPRVPSVVITAFVALTALLQVLAGCASKKTILNPTVERTPIVFESPQAAETFEDELDDRYDSGDADVAQLGRLSRNAFFNQQIKVADHDNDGIITDAEAQAYAE